MLRGSVEPSCASASKQDGFGETIFRTSNHSSSESSLILQQQGGVTVAVLQIRPVIPGDVVIHSTGSMLHLDLTARSIIMHVTKGFVLLNSQNDCCHLILTKLKAIVHLDWSR